jgi:hypothetical protein
VVNPYANIDNLTLKLCQGIAAQRLLGLFTALRFLTLSECQMHDEWVEVLDPGEIALGFLTCPTLEVLTLSPREEDRFLSSSRRDKLTGMVSHRMQRGCLKHVQLSKLHGPDGHFSLDPGTVSYLGQVLDIIPVAFPPRVFVMDGEELAELYANEDYINDWNWHPAIRSW